MSANQQQQLQQQQQQQLQLQQQHQMQNSIQQSHHIVDSQPIYQPKQQPNYQMYQTQSNTTAMTVSQEHKIYPPPPNYQHRHQLSDTTAHTTAGILVNKSQTQTLSRQSNTVTFAKDTLDSSTPADSGMCDMRDKTTNIYKCSTLRHGGKFDSAKPSIQNCPLPAIPTNTANVMVPLQNQVQTVQIKKEGKESIYSTRVLPQNRKIPTGKAVPLPKIGSFEKTPSTNLSTFASPPPVMGITNSNVINSNSNNEATYSIKQRDQSLPPPPTASELKQQMAQMQAQSQQQQQQQQQQVQHQGNNGNIDGSEFYAVTEL